MPKLKLTLRCPTCGNEWQQYPSESAYCEPCFQSRGYSIGRTIDRPNGKEISLYVG